MELHFRNLEYLTPPGCLTELLPHPFNNSDNVQLAIFNEHRYAFFFWNKWTNALLKEEIVFDPPSLVTLDWHQDLMPPDENEKGWLDELDIFNNKDVALYTWANLTNINDGQIMAAAYLNLIGNVYVHCRQGKFDHNWTDKLFQDKYGNLHTIRKFKKYSDLEKVLLSSIETNVYFDIDLDYFTLNNPLNGIGKTFTYMPNREIRLMLDMEHPLIRWVMKRLRGFTIALEAEHTGGLMKANHLLNVINNIYFKPSIFSNYGENWNKSSNWKHLKR